MKRVYVNENGVWDVTCANITVLLPTAEMNDMAKLKGIKVNPRIQVEEHEDVCFAVNCRHCEEPLCVKSCISGALSVHDGVIEIDQNKCVGCYTCIMACPYGAVVPSDEGVIQKCELCIKNSCGEPACVKGCPNHAIVFEER